MEIKNLKKLANRLKKAVRNNERIILYGDADLDGICSVIITKETLQSLGGQITAVYFPDREKHGYGLTEMGLEHLRKWSPALLLLLDCGISNFREVELAKKIAFEVIVFDHHEVLQELPRASIIVNPKQKGDEYPFKGLATSGLALKLSEAMLGRKISPSLRNNFLELAALSTLADMMPQEHDNKMIINQGLPLLETSFRPGIQALLASDFGEDQFSLRQKVSKIISILNVRDVGQDSPSAFRLLTSRDFLEAKSLVGELLEASLIKRARVKEITLQVQQIAAEQGDQPIIFAGSADWELILLGIVASTVCKTSKKPVFLYKMLLEESQGSVRAPSGLDSVALMKKCQECLVGFGGHAPASGFRLKNENLEKFKECLIKNLTHA